MTPTFEYGGTSGPWQYFLTGRYCSTKEGIENTTPNYYPIHDFSKQGRYFGDASANIDDTTRLSFISGQFHRPLPNFKYAGADAIVHRLWDKQFSIGADQREPD